PAKCAEFPLSHSDHDGYMSKPKNQNRTFHLLQKADILTCYEHGTLPILLSLSREREVGVSSITIAKGEVGEKS
ncbi:MAG: hypothetical protein ABSD63_19160, partial [Candidatus Korobacteraceae bacterium]